MNATKIAWFSRHAPTKRQRETLAALFGPHQLIINGRTFSSASEIIERMTSCGATELVLVAPLTIIRALTLMGVYPIVARMERCLGSHPEAEYHTRKCHYRFVHFERIEEVSVKSTTLKENSPWQPPKNVPQENAT